MKKRILCCLLALSVSAFSLELSSNGIENGYINEKYGKYGTQNIKGMPSLSLPLKWSDVPKGTKSFAIVIDDNDAIPVTGFTWIHWSAIVPKHITELTEDASMRNKDIVQGVNSWVSNMGGLTKAEASHFGGPAPPDKEHTYNITLYALNKEINLPQGYYLNELYKEMDGSIIEQVTLKAKYKN